jgi:tRNA (cytidine/uridine-2'-O-)-methyltransferase
VPIDVIEPCGFPFSDREVRRAAMDYGQMAQVTRHASWPAFLSLRREEKGRLLLFTTRAAQPFQTFDYRPDDVLLFGRESAGVPDAVHEAADARLIIPLAPGARSLNLTLSAAMALSEGLRQTNGFPSPAGTG